MIEVNNLTRRSINKPVLKKIAQKVLEEEGKSKKELSIALIGAGRIKKLNKKFLGKSKTTDVLAFPDDVGEIVICPEKVKENAERLRTTFDRELALCLIHGILHLLGYDHENSKEDAKKMEEKQNYYLAKWQDLIS